MLCDSDDTETNKKTLKYIFKHNVEPLMWSSGCNHYTSCQAFSLLWKDPHYFDSGQLQRHKCHFPELAQHLKIHAGADQVASRIFIKQLRNSMETLWPADLQGLVALTSTVRGPPWRLARAEIMACSP